MMYLLLILYYINNNTISVAKFAELGGQEDAKTVCFSQSQYYRIAGLYVFENMFVKSILRLPPRFKLAPFRR